MRASTTPERPSALAIAAYLIVVVIAIYQPAYLVHVTLDVLQASTSLLVGLMNGLLAVVEHLVLFPLGL